MKMNDLPLLVGLIAMVLLIYGTISEPGSQQQKILFVIGAPALGVTAYANKQKMFALLQLVATVGAILAFFQSIPEIWRYAIMGFAAVVSLAYLYRTRYFDSDRYGLIGAVGLLCIALGFATNASASPFLFGIFLGVGGLLVAAYSALQFFYNKVKIALIWVVLNILFSISPLMGIFR